MPPAQRWIAFGTWSLLSLQATLRAAEEPAEPTPRQQFTVRPATSEIRVDSVLDERLDPITATHGAARYLREALEKLESWPLALTGYNHGIAGMERAARRLGTKDMAVIIEKYKSRTFGFASRNFYVSFLAASDVNADPERYFGPVKVVERIGDGPITADEALSWGLMRGMRYLVRTRTTVDPLIPASRSRNPAMRP